MIFKHGCPHRQCAGIRCPRFECARSGFPPQICLCCCRRVGSWIRASLIVYKCWQYAIMPQFIRGIYRLTLYRVGYTYLVEKLVCGTKLVANFKSNMAALSLPAGPTDSNADVVRCLNTLTSLDMWNTASDECWPVWSGITLSHIRLVRCNTDDDNKSGSNDDVDNRSAVDNGVVDTALAGERSWHWQVRDADNSGVFIALFRANYICERVCYRRNWRVDVIHSV